MSVTARGSPLCTRLTEEKRVSGFYFLHRSPFPLIFTNFKENLFFFFFRVKSLLLNSIVYFLCISHMHYTFFSSCTMHHLFNLSCINFYLSGFLHVLCRRKECPTEGLPLGLIPWGGPPRILPNSFDKTSKTKNKNPKLKPQDW